ncbi:MAG TPA: hypothetical protein VK756_00885 [Solirubrobacteraceae bacterium]|nr:hypothetical protein [Solirubrobacteraceae bacterium]
MRYRVLVPKEPNREIPRGAALLEVGRGRSRVFIGRQQFGRSSLTDERLQKMEAARTAVAALEDVVTRARNRAIAQAVAARWTYARIGRATGLSNSPIGQIAPTRAGRDPAAPPRKPKARRQSK